MKLYSLRARNFMPYKGEMELTFPLDEQRNVLIVFGENMRGKTSILNAIRWAFYGEALGRHSRPIPLQDIVNKEAALADDWRVEAHVKFDANGYAYDLRRVADRRQLVAAPSKPEDFTVSIHLTRDGSVVAGDQVEAEIGLIAPQQVSRFFLFDGELLQEYETLLIEGSEQGQQIKEAIEQVLGVPALTNGRVDIQTIAKQARRRQNADLKQMAGLETQAARHEELTGRVETIDRDLDVLNNKLKKVREERTALEDELEPAQSVLGAQARLSAKLEEQEFLIEECRKKEAERLDLRSGAWKDLIDGRLQVRRSQLESQRKDLMSSIRERSGLAQRVSDLEHLLDTRECPTCRQGVSEEQRSQIGEALGRAEAEMKSIEDSSDALQDISGQLDALSKIRGINARERLRQAERELQGYHVRLTQAENDIEKLRDQIAGYDTGEMARKRVLHSEKIKEEGRLQGSIQGQVRIDRT